MKSLALLPLMLFAGQADAREGAIDLGVSGGATFMDPLEVLGTSPSFSPRVGYWVNDTLLLEADIGFTIGETAIGTPDPFPFLSLTPRVNVVGRVWPDEPVNLLFVAGLGAWYKSIDDGGELNLPQGDGSDLDLLANAGPGVMIPLGDTLALRTDLRWMMSLGTENWENRGDAFMSWELTGGLALRIGGVKDTDKDGIADKLEGELNGVSCIDQPEDFDEWQDEDGCPDVDNDEDGILDVDDVDCPNDAEDMDEFNDEDGCPDLDNDEDGIPDEEDDCPMVTGVESGKGCPDEDGDGVVDKIDECQRDAANDEVGNAFGCPDGDADGVPDYRDSCPEEAGAEDASPFRSNGCATRVYATEDGLKVTEPVAWSGTSGRFKSSSNLLVDDISETIKGVRSLKTFEIQVFAEGDDDKALEVAQKRADNMMDVIVKDGASADRLTAKGVKAPKVEGDGPHPNVFIKATDKEEITGLKRRYTEPKKEAPKEEEKKEDDGAEKKAPRTPAPAPEEAKEEKPAEEKKTAPREAPAEEKKAEEKKADEGEGDKK